MMVAKCFRFIVSCWNCIQIHSILWCLFIAKLRQQINKKILISNPKDTERKLDWIKKTIMWLFQICLGLIYFIAFNQSLCTLPHKNTSMRSFLVTTVTFQVKSIINEFWSHLSAIQGGVTTSIFWLEMNGNDNQCHLLLSHLSSFFGSKLTTSQGFQIFIHA
jgi:hypothetical protein